MSEHAALLAQLQQHAVLTATLPQRTRRTLEEAAAEIENCLEPRPSLEVEAIRLVANFNEAVALIRQLGNAKYEPAIDTLTQLWKNCPVVPVRNAAGYALLEFDSPDAHSALQSRLDEADMWATSLGVRSIVSQNPLGAFQCFSELFTRVDDLSASEEALVSSALQLLSPHGILPSGELRYSDHRVPLWLRNDRRWIRVASALRRHPKFGAQARAVLGGLTHEEVDQALQRWPDRPRPALATRATPDFLSRYSHGDLTAWGELVTLGPLDEALRLEARAVARELMKRVRHNAELVTARLHSRDYPFAEEFGPPLPPPPKRLGARLEKLETIAGGPIPASLHAFWLEVGSINWQCRAEQADETICGSRMKLGELDPLCVSSLACSWYSVDEWLARRREEHPAVVGPLYIDLAPDYLHKANVSGGAPYAMRVPNEAADGPFEFEASNSSFVDYLRVCFEWGGFPRARYLKSLERSSLDFMAELKRDLVPF